MRKTEILQKDAPVLRETAKSVSVKNIGTKKIQGLLERMKEALHAEEDGVALAAPQIGESLRIFMVNGEILVSKQGKKTDLVFINPEIIKTSKKKKRVEEGCLSLRYLYGQVQRSEKVTIKAYDETGKTVVRGASGLLAQIFQHEIDHLNGILFIDTAEHIRDMPPARKPAFVFFGSLPAGKVGSQFSRYVLEELELAGFSPLLSITSARDTLPTEELGKAGADVFVVASFGKILPKELIELPRYKTLNVHPSLLPQLRGPAPIQDTILGKGVPGVTIIRMDEKMDHGPILVQAKVLVTPWPDHYHVVEEKLGRAGGKILAKVLSKWVNNEIREIPQNDSQSSYTKLIKKDDGLLNLNDRAEVNLKKVLAYSTWPGAYIFFKNKRGKEVRVVIKDAKVEGGQFFPTRVIPAGKREMDWQDFLRGN
ncbi:MAG: Peptide deformylase [Parcubacteria group bacterium GW2011_GWA2_45_15]|nr:MAG: Peptide deformylase [Parcubacteria group bacterium GW2011_GWA2_45_15]